MMSINTIAAEKRKKDNCRLMEIKPFRAFRFDADIVGDVGNCIAPPYDVINTAQQQKLYEKNEYNIVRITRGKTTPSDNQSNNQYTRAAGYFNDWIKNGVLKQDSAESIYAYVQDFKLAGKKFQRASFIASAKLEEFGKTVRPHEETLDEPKIDRLNLQRATAAVFGLVFMLYEDQQKVAEKIIKKAAKEKPLVDFTDEDVRHRLFAIIAEKDIEAIAEMMQDKSCIIADGHHRYATALSYYKETGSQTASHQMMAFANIYRNGVVILASHRLIGSLKNFRIEDLIDKLGQNFKITEFRFDSPTTKKYAKQEMLSQMKHLCWLDKNVFGIYGGGAFYTAVLKNKQAMDSAAQEKSCSWKTLDTSVLHKLVLEELLGIDEKQLAGGGNIEYVKGTENAIDELIIKIDRKQKQVVFFMNPVKTEQLKMITAAGEKMPQKSTYFYPKVYTGLTINKL